MRRWWRSGSLCALLVLLGALAPAAHAAGASVEIDSVPGQIYDVDATRILFKQSDDAFAIESRSSGDVTAIPTAAGADPRGGFLTSHGVLLATTTSSSPYANLTELRGASTVDLGGLDGSTSLRVAGEFAEWSNGTALMRRDLTTGTDVQVASDAGNTDDDVAANGDVAYWTTGYGISRYRGAASTPLTTEDVAHPQTYPRTDGTNVVWRETSPFCCGAPGFGVLHGYGPSGPFELANTGRGSSPQPGADYRVAGGWIAFTRGEVGATEVWLRPPGGGDGDEVQVSGPGSNAIAGLAADGELIYVNTAFGADGVVLYRPGAGATPVELTQSGSGPGGERGYGNHVFSADGHWYSVEGGSLKRLTPAESGAGSRTEITAAPGPGDTAATVHASFVSHAGDTAFECKLDAGTYAPCTSPVTYTSLQHGEHTLAVRGVIDADHVETDPAVAAWRVEGEPPAVTIAGAPAGRSSDATPAFAGAAGDAAEDGTEVTLAIFRGGTATGAPVRTIHATRTAGSWSAHVQLSLPDGEYTAEAQQSDAAGNVGRSQPATFTIDATPPAAAIDPSRSPALSGRQVTFDASGSSDAGGGTIVRYEWDLDGDGDFERDTGGSAGTSTTYATPRLVHPAVRATDSAGNRGIERIDLTVAPDPPPGLLGVTVNDGERFTNDPNVFISPVWPPGDTHILLSNDGGFRDAVSAPLATNIPWRLDSSGPERLPKTIYARFSPNGTTYQDDIILDETPPAVTLAEIANPELSPASASKRTYHLHVKARDRTAGVSRMQITTNRARPGKRRRYRSRVKFRAASAKIFVRVRDRAGNWSRWKRCST